MKGSLADKANDRDEDKDKTVSYSEDYEGPWNTTTSGKKKDLAETKRNMAASLAAIKRRATSNRMGDGW